MTSLALASILLGSALLEPNPVQRSKPTQSAAEASMGEEDLSSVRRKTKLTRSTPLVFNRDEGTGFQRELVSMAWRPLDEVRLSIMKPKGVPKPPVMLLLYTWPQTADQRFLSDAFAERVTQFGVAAVGFESALTGSRYRNRPMREWFVSELHESLAKSTHDVSYILDYLATRGDLDMSRVGMFGTGSGASIAILAAVADPRIRALDLLNPWGDWPTWFKSTSVVKDTERSQFTTAAKAKSVANFEPVARLRQLRIPVRLSLIQSDTEVPVAVQKKLRAAVPAGAVVRSFADDMELFQASQGGATFQWLAEKLKAVKPRAAAAAPRTPSPTPTRTPARKSPR